MVEDSLSEGLRARKKRLMRQLISDTATEMMLERGFDEVRVSDVAEAVGVSEKTVYNYFPTKESLLLDREEDMTSAIREALGPGSPDRSPVEAVVAIIRREVEGMSRAMEDRSSGQDITMIQRFGELIEHTPALRAAQVDMMERLVRVAAETLAERAGVSPDDPEPQIAADALLGLWRVQYTSLRRHAADGRPFAEMCGIVMDEVDRAARLVDSGLWSFNAIVGGQGGRDQLRTVAESAQTAGRQVAAAIRQARSAWSEVQAMHEARHAQMGQYGPGMKRQVALEMKRRLREEMQQQAEEQRRLGEEMQRQTREYAGGAREQSRRVREEARRAREEAREAARRAAEEAKEQQRNSRGDQSSS